ncbi:hypothetical protein [Rufibacter psychrotolerans]|uniref:hypothetical protein n=1 Tax=Rufibacter psychrotolerans TaxID=2812556 RepID=UPI00196749A4|nr:hypothetical protein [Rufibacter sp. SYSU D00308]
MHLSLTPKNLLAFLALLFICHELHELAHTLMQYVICGCWGPRDFLGWKTCGACDTRILATWIFLFGPLLSYGLMWVAFGLMAPGKRAGQKALGWALLFANLPLGRLIPVLDREGDESLITRNIINKESMTVLSWGTELALVFLLTLPVLFRAWQVLEARHRVWVYAGFLTLPLLAESLLMNGLANWFLRQKVLAGDGILGSPVLMNVWNAGWLLVLLFTYEHLYTLLRPAQPAIDPAREAPAGSLLTFKKEKRP